MTRISNTQGSLEESRKLLCSVTPLHMNKVYLESDDKYVNECSTVYTQQYTDKQDTNPAIRKVLIQQQV